MGIVNVTPDSFSDGGQFADVDRALRYSLQLIDEGADILDIGGESTRPGSEPVDAQSEINRVIPLIEKLREEKIATPISIDTSKAIVAARALEAGASIINDVSALADPEMADLAAEQQCGLILMHMRGNPKTMQSQPIHYADLIAEVRDYLQDAADKAIAAGVDEARIMLDPGIGFGKEFEDNLDLTNRLEEIRFAQRPIVYGPSRKRFLGTITQKLAPERDSATLGACTTALNHGANIFRVHNVALAKDALHVAHTLNKRNSELT